MAGSYPDVPSRRFAWDADGTVAAVRNKSVEGPVTSFSSTEAEALNDEEFDGVTIVGVASKLGDDGSHVWEAGLIFPELREFDGLFIKAGGSGNANDYLGAVESSGDTTNLIDGTWTSRTADWTDLATVSPDYRDSITSYAVSNVRGIRIRSKSSADGRTFRALHAYGTIAAGETPDRLLWVDNDTGSEFGLPIDYGDIPRGSAEDTEVLLRNNSGSLTAASVQVTAEALYLNSGAWYTFKEAGGSFQATLPLSSSIGAGSDSPVLTIRRIVPDDETLGLHAGRAVASVGSWS